MKRHPNAHNVSRWLGSMFACLLLAPGSVPGVSGAALAAEARTTVSAGPVEAVDDGEKVKITFEGELVCQYIYKGYAKPIIYPLHGPHGIQFARNHPMKKDVEGEAADHPHHKAISFTHDDVNGEHFWHEGEGAGQIVNRKQPMLTATWSGKKATVTIKSANKWVADDKTICTDEETITVHRFPDGDVAIDYAKSIHASEGEVTFGDTKEGTMAIRTHPALRIDKGAKAVNSEGVEGKSVWGKRAKWVDYSAKIDGKTVGVAVFDHPSNPRHPTWWHARAYGLIAANAFGVHNFEGKPKGTGDFTIKKGDTATFKYRFLLHHGDTEGADIPRRYAEFAGEQPAAE